MNLVKTKFMVSINSRAIVCLGFQQKQNHICFQLVSLFSPGEKIE